MIDVFRALREHGTLSTSALQDHVFEKYTDEWATERTMWNAIDRYLEDVPGVEKGGYGEWTYAGDDAVRAAIGYLVARFAVTVDGRITVVSAD